jgi:hypothetical protein
VLRPATGVLGAALFFVLLAGVATSISVKACPFSGAFASLERTTATPALKAIADQNPPPVIEIATTSSVWDSNAVFRRTSNTAAWGLLGLSLLLLAALNLGFFRHLVRVYACSQARHRHVK